MTYRSLVETTTKSIRENDFLEISYEDSYWRISQLEQLGALEQELGDQNAVLRSAQDRLAICDPFQRRNPLAHPLRSSRLVLRSSWGKAALELTYEEAICSIATALVTRLNNPENRMCSYYSDREFKWEPPYEWRLLAKAATELFGENQLSQTLRYTDWARLKLPPGQRNREL